MGAVRTGRRYRAAPSERAVKLVPPLLSGDSAKVSFCLQEENERAEGRCVLIIPAAHLLLSVKLYDARGV